MCAFFGFWRRLPWWQASGGIRRRRLSNPTKQLSQFGHHSWTQQQGLPQDSVRAIVQAPDGALWIGTDEGLARFDGTDFTVFRQSRDGLPSGSITALLAARDGAIWVGTLGSIFTPRERPLHALQPGDWPRHSDRHRPLRSTRRHHLGGRRQVRLPPFTERENRQLRARRGRAGGRPAQIVETADGVLVFAGFAEVVRFDGATFRPYSVEIIDGFGAAITVDRDGVIWIGTTRGLVAVERDGGMRHYDAADGIPAVPVRSVVSDRDGTLWIGTSNGLAKRQSDRFVRATSPNLRPGAYVWDFFEDRDGSLWVGTNSGLHRFREQQFTMFGTPEGFPAISRRRCSRTRRAPSGSASGTPVCWPSAAARAAGSLAPTACRATRSSASAARATAPCGRHSWRSHAHRRARHDDPRAARQPRTANRLRRRRRRPGPDVARHEQRRDPRRGHSAHSDFRRRADAGRGRDRRRGRRERDVVGGGVRQRAVAIQGRRPRAVHAEGRSLVRRHPHARARRRGRALDWHRRRRTELAAGREVRPPHRQQRPRQQQRRSNHHRRRRLPLARHVARACTHSPRGALLRPIPPVRRRDVRGQRRPALIAVCAGISDLEWRTARQQGPHVGGHIQRAGDDRTA